MDVGSRIKSLREERHITVNKLANLSGVSQSYLRDIELGNKQPTVEYLEYICFGLGITLQDFFCETSCEDRLERAIQGLSVEQKICLADFLESIKKNS